MGELSMTDLCLLCAAPSSLIVSDPLPSLLTRHHAEELLMPRLQGTVPVQYIMYDLWQSMHACDDVLATAVLESTFIFMRAQTDKVYLSMNGFNQYLEYGERDVGKGFVYPPDRQYHPVSSKLPCHGQIIEN